MLYNLGLISAIQQYNSVGMIYVDIDNPSLLLIILLTFCYLGPVTPPLDSANLKYQQAVTSHVNSFLGKRRQERG